MTSLEALKSCHIVVEAVFEKLALKQVGNLYMWVFVLSLAHILLLHVFISPSHYIYNLMHFSLFYPSFFLFFKQAIFADLAKICCPTCVLATNTSTLDVDAIASAAGPDRVGSVRDEIK